MKYSVFWRCCGLLQLTVICMALSLAGPAAGAEQGAELRQKIEQLSEMRQRLSTRIEQAGQLRAALLERRRELVDELKDMQARLRFSSFQKAAEDPHVRFNLDLIRMLEGYLAELDGKIAYLREGSENLMFLHRRAQDEWKVLQKLSVANIGGLIDPIDQMLGEYQAEMEGALLLAESEPQAAVEVIWRDILSGKL
jgi:chromosome segregation ATPase